MKRYAVWSVFMTLFIASTANAQAIPHLSSGSPGCLKLLLERPMAERIAMKLKGNCRELRNAYLSSLDVYSNDPEKFEKELSKALRSNKSPEPAYRAILMAAIFGQKDLLPALEARAKIEQTKKLRYQYASAAVERMKKGECTKTYADAQYDEVCRLSSPVVRRIIDLSGASVGASVGATR